MVTTGSHHWSLGYSGDLSNHYDHPFPQTGAHNSKSKLASQIEAKVPNTKVVCTDILREHAITLPINTWEPKTDCCIPRCDVMLYACAKLIVSLINVHCSLVLDLGTGYPPISEQFNHCRLISK